MAIRCLASKLVIRAAKHLKTPKSLVFCRFLQIWKGLYVCKTLVSLFFLTGNKWDVLELRCWKRPRSQVFYLNHHTSWTPTNMLTCHKNIPKVSVTFHLGQLTFFKLQLQFHNDGNLKKVPQPLWRLTWRRSLDNTWPPKGRTCWKVALEWFRICSLKYPCWNVFKKPKSRDDTLARVTLTPVAPEFISWLSDQITNLHVPWDGCFQQETLLFRSNSGTHQASKSGWFTATDLVEGRVSLASNVLWSYPKTPWTYFHSELIFSKVCHVWVPCWIVLEPQRFCDELFREQFRSQSTNKDMWALFGLVTIWAVRLALPSWGTDSAEVHFTETIQ